MGRGKAEESAKVFVSRWGGQAPECSQQVSNVLKGYGGSFAWYI